jgi:hypothetical protein
MNTSPVALQWPIGANSVSAADAGRSASGQGQGQIGGLVSAKSGSISAAQWPAMHVHGHGHRDAVGLMLHGEEVSRGFNLYPTRKKKQRKILYHRRRLSLFTVHRGVLVLHPESIQNFVFIGTFAFAYL